MKEEKVFLVLFIFTMASMYLVVGTVIFKAIQLSPTRLELVEYCQSLDNK